MKRRPAGRIVFAGSLAAGLAVAVSAAAQERPDRLVALYVQVGPDAVAAASKTLRAYAAGARREPGAGPIQVLREITHAGRFVVVETWRDEAALAAHEAAPARAGLEARLKPLEIAPIDERVGLPMGAGPATPPHAGVHVVMHIDVVPEGKDAAAGWLAEQIKAAAAMPGSLGFEVATQANRANHFTVHETWASRAAYEAYAASPGGREFRARLTPIKGAVYDDRLFTVDQGP